MTNQLPTVDIKGKEYVLVKDRILAFNETYPNGSIETELVSSEGASIVVMKATVTPDVAVPTRRFIDYSQATIGQGMVNTTSALENASTSAVGRALAYMGIGVIESIASADEVVKATNQTQEIVRVPINDTTLPVQEGGVKVCSAHDEPIPMKQGLSKTKKDKDGNPKTFWFHSEADRICFGSGWQ